jgi:hypothetical protein
MSLGRPWASKCLPYFFLLTLTSSSLGWLRLTPQLLHANPSCLLPQFWSRVLGAGPPPSHLGQLQPQGSNNSCPASQA